MANLNKIKEFVKRTPGKFAALLVMALLVTGLASAAIVTYLSNTVTATATVTSPVSVGISTTPSGYGTTPLSFPTTGGSTISYFTETSNLANNPITGQWQVLVSSPGISCADITSLTGKTDDGTTVTGPTDVVGSCAVVNGTTVSYNYNSGSVLGVSYVDQGDWVLTFAPTALGTYDVETKFVP